jgi:formamidopyrimidine-DNA glycosylase
LQGAAVRALRRRGKYLVADLSTGATLVMHLGMSGSFEIQHRGPGPFALHDHVIFHMSNGATVVFNDPRRFGSMWLFDDVDSARNPTFRLGPEPLEETFGAEVLADAFRGRRAPLKATLLDQRLVAGLGNIYVSEALHRARLSPRRASGTLVGTSPVPKPQLRALLRAIRDTLNDALLDRSDGGDRFRVYDREGERCPRRGCRGTIKRIVQSGRSTFFCPLCQR